MKCPRCDNEEVLKEHKFCKICGLDLKSNKKNTTSKIEMVDERLLSVVEVTETTNIQLVNNLLQKKWIVIRIVDTNDKYLFLLGRIGN